MGVLFICGALVYTFSNLKTYAIALGQDPQQLRRWGRHPASVLLILFGFQGILAGAAGSMLSTLPPDFIAGSEHQLSLSVLSICLLSGLGFQGGRPQMHRVMMALLAILSLEQLFLKLSLSHHWQGALHSSILLLALMIQQREQEH
jgi:L-arabinose transport system permease protein